MFKYLPFSAGKTAHLDRLCLENSLEESRANVGRLFVCLSVENPSWKMADLNRFHSYKVVKGQPATNKLCRSHDL